MMASFTIELQPSERALVEQIEFNALRLQDASDAARNAELVVMLTQALISRDAIPEHRRCFFTDPRYNVGGRGKSRQQIFERNGCHGAAILQHPHFLPYLNYFIYGAALPDPVRESFRAEVMGCGMVTSGDVVPLGQKARALTRQHRLIAHDAREEFFKLALDCGLDALWAVSIRDAVSTVR